MRSSKLLGWIVGALAVAWASAACATDGIPVNVGTDSEDPAITAKSWSVSADCPVGALLTVEAHVGLQGLTITITDNSVGGPNTWVAEAATNTSVAATDRFFHTIVTHDMAIGRNLTFGWGGTATTSYSRFVAQCTTGMGAIDVVGTWSVLNASTVSKATGTLAVPNETIFSFNDEDTANGAWTANSPFTQLTNLTYGGRTQLAYDAVTVCTSVTSAPSLPSAQNIAVNVYSFQSSTPGSCAGTTAPPKGQLMGVGP